MNSTSSSSDSFSLVSSQTGLETEQTPSLSAQHTDDFSFVVSGDDEIDPASTDSDASTSVIPSVYEHEYHHGRRYHSYKSGRYPLPNDSVEQHIEELKHQIMVDLMVSIRYLERNQVWPMLISPSPFPGGPLVSCRYWRSSSENH